MFKESRIFRDILLIVAAVLCVACGSPSVARPTHGGIATSVIGVGCPFALDNGCAAALANSSFRTSDSAFRATAIDDGHTNIIASYIPPANRAGIEFGVGRDTTKTLKDPTTASIAGCTYQPLGAPQSGSTARGPVLLCSANGVDIVIDAVDFTGNSSGGIGCIGLRLAGGSSTNTITVSNSKFAINGGFCQNAAMIVREVNQTVIYRHNDFDGQYSIARNGNFVLSDVSTGTVDHNEWYYNYFHEIGGRIGGGPRGFGHQYFDYNYVDGYGLDTQYNPCDPINGGAGGVCNLHGELFLWGGQGATTKFGAIEYKGNTIIYRRAQFPNAQFSTTFYCLTGAARQPATSCVVDANTVIMNRGGNGVAIASTALFEMEELSVDNLTVTNNVIYPSGGFGCGLIGAPNNQSTASASGNIITVSAITTTWSPGWVISRDSGAAFTTATMLPYGTGGTTGTGSTGTYTFDGPAQTVASTGSWRVTPPIGVNTTSGNINLVNGEAVNPTGKTWSATCTGHG